MYKPLPSFLTVRQSAIEGLGLFASDNIPANIDLGMSHILVDEVVIRTPLGGFYNHSDNPNCIRKQVSPKQWNLFTLKDIEAGEEITAKYTLYNL